MLWYTYRYLRAHRIRVAMTVAGLALSLASIFIIYGVAGSVEFTSARALTYLTEGMDLWVTPPQGVSLDNKLGAITSSGTLPDSIVVSAKQIDDSARIVRVSARKVSVDGQTVVFYATDRQTGSALEASTALWAMLGSHTTQVAVNGTRAIVSRVDPQLPTLSLSGSFSNWSVLLNPGGQADMLLIATSRPGLLGPDLANRTGGKLEDTPDQIGHPSAADVPSIFLLSTSLSRFDPFSFGTKFSSLTLNSTMSTILGWTSKGIFFVGLLLSVTSSLIGVRERRSEIEVFILSGMRGEFTLLLIVESVILVGLAFFSGTLLAIASLAWLLPNGVWLHVVGPALGMGCLYTFILVLVAPLVAAHQVASESVSVLLRSPSLR